MIITIDGPAGSGKSVAAKELSKKLGIIHFNSGSLYRALTAFALENQISPLDFEDFAKKTELKLVCEYIDGIQHVLVNGKDYTSILRNNEISVASSLYATLKVVHILVNKCQHDFAKTHSFVVDGRECGSHVFPNADFKFYLDCALDIRAKRRYDEEIKKGNILNLLDIKSQIEKRDFEDKHRKIAPLVIPFNAIIIDSSNMTVDEVVNSMLKVINKI